MTFQVQICNRNFNNHVENQIILTRRKLSLGLGAFAEEDEFEDSSEDSDLYQ